jgi:hypothetical protein
MRRGEVGKEETVKWCLFWAISNLGFGFVIYHQKAMDGYGKYGMARHATPRHATLWRVPCHRIPKAIVGR